MPDQTQSESQRTMTVLEEIYQRRDPPAETARRQPRRTRSWREFSWSRAVAPFTVLLGVVSLGVGAAQLRHTIRSPALRFAQLAQVAPNLRDFAERASKFPGAGGQSQDTDGDGLPDAQEQTLGTSAYLEDSDSDGVRDGYEVKAGTDPNCPSGQTCTPAATPTPAVSPALPLPNLAPAFDFELAPTAAPSPALGGSPAVPVPPLPAGAIPTSPQALRQMLLERGVPADVLEKISDAELEQLVAESLPANPQAP